MYSGVLACRPAHGAQRPGKKADVGNRTRDLGFGPRWYKGEFLEVVLRRAGPIGAGGERSELWNTLTLCLRPGSAQCSPRQQMFATVAK